MKKTKTQDRLLVILYNNGARLNGESMMAYKHLERETKLSHRALKSAITGLRFQGLVAHLPAVDDDGKPNGSGFMLTGEGETEALTLEGVEKDLY